jgi:hypothetical protein
MLVGGKGGLIQLLKPKNSPDYIVFPFTKETNVIYILTSLYLYICYDFSKIVSLIIGINV